MELEDFLRDVHSAIRDELSRVLGPGESPISAEELFTEQVMNHLTTEGITFEANVCHFEAKVGSSKVKLSGYSVDDTVDDNGFPDRIDLFVSLYKGVNEIELVADLEIGRAATQGLQFLRLCANGKLSRQLDETNSAYPVVKEVERIFDSLTNIRIYIITDGMVKTRDYAPQEVEGKRIRIEVMDIQRLFNHLQGGTPRDEITVNFEDLCGAPLPSVWVPGAGDNDYDYVLTAIPGNALCAIYDKFGPRILEANVRSFLGVSSKGVNKGIRDTLRETPNRFMAYNNGIVLVADLASFSSAQDGSVGIRSLQGLQIVNGGQTTASIYFAKRKYPDIALETVRVPAKIIIVDKRSGETETLISNISRFANSQNVVKQSDLSANKPYHRELEKLSLRVYCPDGVGRWFYERSAGSYKVMLEKETSTPVQKKKLQADIPVSRKLSKPDLAKYILAWGQQPHVVSLGGQKNFQAFMEGLEERESRGLSIIPSVLEYKLMIAKVIIFKCAHKVIRPAFPAFQANITAYTVSVLAAKLGSVLDLMAVWDTQAISPQLQMQILVWSREINNILQRSSKGRMISEWAKKPECWDEVVNQQYTEVASGIPEISKFI